MKLFDMMIILLLTCIHLTNAKIDFSQIVQQINNNPQSTWIAQMPSERDINRASYFFGGYKKFKGTLPKFKQFDISKGKNIPDEFDNRVAYPQCPSIRTIRDQCACGSCFAFGAITAFEDRICIKLKQNVTLSAEDLISCHIDENMSCDGGNPIAVWQNVFAGKSQGDGAIQESCYPYSIPNCPCNHHSQSSSFPDCPTEGSISTPSCDFSKKFECQDKGIFRSEEPTLIQSDNMEQEIYENGPITVAFTVYDDFLTYKSGVYQKSENAKPLGGHSVRIVGYGVSDTGIKYWTVANSWNSEWGDQGFFKIRRGVNECNIESDAVVAGIPIKNNFVQQ